jgi:hypothetical protein
VRQQTVQGIHCRFRLEQGGEERPLRCSQTRLRPHGSAHAHSSRRALDNQAAPWEQRRGGGGGGGGSGGVGTGLRVRVRVRMWHMQLLSQCNRTHPETGPRARGH